MGNIRHFGRLLALPQAGSGLVLRMIKDAIDQRRYLTICNGRARHPTIWVIKNQ
jgi:hypothetical protein